MRKLFIVIIILLLPFIAKAQDTTAQAPIIVQYKDKLMAVSPEDGSSRDLVQLPPKNIFVFWEPNLLSPDGKKLLYSVQTDTTDLTKPDAVSTSIESLFLLDLTDGTSTDLQASGGVFDRKRPGHTYSLAYHTWSYDGSRVYFTRLELHGTADQNVVEVQLVYYELATKQYHLVARTDPKRSVPTLSAIDSGVLADWSNDNFASLYAPDNNETKVSTALLGYLVDYQGEHYSAMGDVNGGIVSLTNITTGQKKSLGQWYYPAMRSQLAGDQSLLAVYTQNNSNKGTYYRIFSSAHKLLVKVLDAGADGVTATLSPDGQSIAYLQFDEYRNALIRIVKADGSNWELPILADSIVWGPTEYVVFRDPLKGKK